MHGHHCHGKIRGNGLQQRSVLLCVHRSKKRPQRHHAKPLDGDDAANVKTRKTLEELLNIFPARTTQILEYFLDVSLFCQWKRENAKALDLDAEKLKRDVSYYSDLGVGGITTFSGFMDGEWRAKYGDGDIKLYGKTLDEFFV